MSVSTVRQCVSQHFTAHHSCLDRRVRILVRYDQGRHDHRLHLRRPHLRLGRRAQPSWPGTSPPRPLPLRQPHTHRAPQGLSNFQNGQAFIGGFSAFAQTFVYAFYSYGGVELVSLAAGESACPHKAVPRAVRATFFRIVVFYILTMLTIGLNINWQDPTLLNAASGELSRILLSSLPRTDALQTRASLRRP